MLLMKKHKHLAKVITRSLCSYRCSIEYNKHVTIDWDSEWTLSQRCHVAAQHLRVPFPLQLIPRCRLCISDALSEVSMWVRSFHDRTFMCQRFLRLCIHGDVFDASTFKKRVQFLGKLTRPSARYRHKIDKWVRNYAKGALIYLILIVLWYF